MITLRQGKAKTILESSINSAITAVETYNRPNKNFRIENYVVLMVIAWTKLFHAYFHATIGERYFYKEKNGRYKKIDGEKKAWELNKCIQQFQKNTEYKMLSEAAIENLKFFIEIRNKIEHRYWGGSALDIVLFGECQSLLFNYENLIMTLFGNAYSINTCLAYALQFSQLRSKEQIISQKLLLSNDMQDLKKFLDEYRTNLPQEIYDSQEYSVKLIQIPKVSNTNRSDLAIEFVNWSELDENDRENYKKVTTIIKDKLVKQRVANADLLKPKHVIRELEKKTGVKLNAHLHTLLWKAFSVRPPPNSEDKFDTNDIYCIYDEPHNDYLYTMEWVDFLANLINNYGFTKESISKLDKNSLKIESYT